MTVASTAKRRRRQLRLSKLSKGRTINARRKMEDAKYMSLGTTKKKKR